MLAGGSARNRMLVKGGSSFNALVRALKQDVVTGAAPSGIRNEQLLYDVDRVSPRRSTGSCGTRSPAGCPSQDQLSSKCTAVPVLKQARPSDGIMRFGQTGAQAAQRRQTQQGSRVMYSHQWCWRQSASWHWR